MKTLTIEELKADIVKCDHDLETVERQRMMILGVKKYLEQKIEELSKEEKPK